MQTENPTEEPTNGSISGTGMITMDHLCIHLSLTVQAKEAIRDICYKRINRLYTIGTIIRNYNKLFTRDCIPIKQTNRDYRLLETIEEYFWSEP